MRQQILDALKAKFQGVSDAILNRIADKLCKTVTTAEQVKATVDAYTWQQVIEGYGDSRATEAQQTAVHNYETKYGLKDGAKINTGDTDTSGQKGGGTPAEIQQQQGGTETTPAWAQALLEANKVLTERLNKMEGERTTSTRKQQLSTVIAKLPESLRKPYERTPVDGLTDEQFNTLLGEVTTEVDGIVQATAQKGAVFGRPNTQGGTRNQDGELTKEQQEAISHRDGVSVKDAQPF